MVILKRKDKLNALTGEVLREGLEVGKGGEVVCKGYPPIITKIFY